MQIFSPFVQTMLERVTVYREMFAAFYIIFAGVEGRNLHKAKLILYTVFSLCMNTLMKNNGIIPTDLYNLIEIYTYHNTYTITQFCSVIFFF